MPPGRLGQGRVDFGGGVLTAAGNSDVCQAEFDPAGNFLRSAGYGDRWEQAGLGVAASATGAVATTGEFVGTIDFGDGPLTDGPPAASDAWLAILAP